jgi:hypothetical protein
VNRANAIDTLLSSTPRLWRGREPDRNQATLATGHSRLDACLPGGGWPLGAVTELITDRPGLGEFSLLFPALSQVSRQGQWLILIDPPWIPYPPALHGHGLVLERLLLVRTSNAMESLWACEQALHGSQRGAVLAWPGRAGFTRLRRLQLAAEAGAKLTFLFLPEPALAAASPAALRLHLRGNELGTRIDILKCRGNRPSEPAWIPPRPAYRLPRPGDSLQEQCNSEHILPSTPSIRAPLPAPISLKQAILTI